jgi:hypothetical protein
MTWEEETVVQKLGLFRKRAYTYADAEAQRKRSKRMRYFLTVWGAMHWADRVTGGRLRVGRRGRVWL